MSQTAVVQGRQANIVGWAHTPFGKLDAPDVEALMAQVSRAALDHAGVSAEDVDAVAVGVYNNGFSRQGFEGALAALGEPALTYVPAPPGRPPSNRRPTPSRAGRRASRW